MSKAGAPAGAGDTAVIGTHGVMRPQLFKRFVKLAYEKAGIAIRNGKEALVTARIAKRQRALAIDDAERYLEYLENDTTGSELNHFLDVISTHFTSFFREPEHFTVLREEFEKRLEQGQRRFRIWSTASSTGEEPYSMAMTLLDACVHYRDSLDIKILATDISLQSLEEARTGIYPGARVEQVPPQLRARYFQKVEGHTDLWQVAGEVRRLVTYKRMNLSTPPFPMRGPLDVVFCRNVLIYFDHPTRQGLITEVDRLVAPGGILCIGHTETLNGIRTRLKIIRPSLFRSPHNEERVR